MPDFLLSLEGHINTAHNQHLLLRCGGGFFDTLLLESFFFLSQVIPNFSVPFLSVRFLKSRFLGYTQCQKEVVP